MKPRKAKRRAAALKGWATRRSRTHAGRPPGGIVELGNVIAAGQYDPDPWARFSAKVKAGWARVLEFLRS